MTESDSDASFVSADEDEIEYAGDPLKKRKPRYRRQSKGDSAEQDHGLENETTDKTEKIKILPDILKTPQVVHSSDDSKTLGDEVEHIDRTENFAESDRTGSPGPSNKSSGWGWSSWGNAIISTATASATTFKNQVGEGLSTVLGTVENTFGAPPPEDIAASIRNEERQRSLNDTENDSSCEAEMSVDIGGIPEELTMLGRGFLSTMTNVIEATSSRVIQTSLDTLEIIGKKTMDVIQEGDPGLKKKRDAINATVQPQSLSEILREAKEQFEKIEVLDADENVNRKVNYSSCFDEYHGLMHLEALEMLSQQNDAKLNSILMSLLSLRQRDEMEPQLAEITAVCSLAEPDSLDCTGGINEIEVCEQLRSLGGNILFEKLFEIYNAGNNIVSQWPEKIDTAFMTEQHDNMIKLLAEITAKAVEILHKIAEVILLPQQMSAMMIAKNLSDFSTCVCCKMNKFAGKFSEQCNTKITDLSLDDDKISAFITNVYLEASNSCSYIQDALQLVVPIINYTIALAVLNKT